MLEPTGDLIGNPMLPALHGGAIASFLELSAGLTAAHTGSHAASAADQHPSSVLLGGTAGTPAHRPGDQTRRTTRRGDEAEAFQEGRAEPICTAQFEFALLA